MLVYALLTIFNVKEAHPHLALNFQERCGVRFACDSSIDLLISAQSLLLLVGSPDWTPSTMTDPGMARYPIHSTVDHLASEMIDHQTLFLLGTSSKVRTA